MRYKVAIFDIDGTLTNRDKVLTPRTRDAVKALQQSGVIVVLASGRPTYGIMPLANELEMAKYGGYILAYNGGVILDCASMREIYTQQLDAQLIPPLYEIATQEGCVMLSYKDERVASEDITDEYVAYEARLNKMGLLQLDSFVESFSHPVPKCLAVGAPEAAAALEARLKPLYGDQMEIYRSEPFFVELVPRGIDKALSLGRLAEHLQLTADDMIAFGDGFNDLTMIEFAGCGVAMANAQERVRDAANFTTLSNDEDGVAHFIDLHLKK